MMCRLGIEEKQQRLDESFVAVLHLCCRFNDSTICRFNVLSFANTKLAEHRVENLLYVDDANDFADRSQRIIKIDSNIFRR